jgi:predicted  nucleic acid-binding Zn-ribbon protein
VTRLSGSDNEKFNNLTEFEEIYLENGLLRGELAALCEELEYIDRVVLPVTQTNYLIKVGALRVELLQVQVEVMKIRRKIAMLRSNLERGEIVHAEALNYKIDREFREWDDRLRHEVSQIEEAKARFSSISVPEDADEIRSIYRILSRKMNPDINPDQSEEAKSFWPSVRAAYLWGDLFHLKALMMMSDDYPESYDMPNDIGQMRQNRDILKKKVASATKKLENAKKHPAFEWRSLLDDPDRLASEQSKLRDEIDRAKLLRIALQDMLNSLEMKGVRR